MFVRSPGHPVSLVSFRVLPSRPRLRVKHRRLDPRRRHARGKAIELTQRAQRPAMILAPDEADQPAAVEAGHEDHLQPGFRQHRPSRRTRIASGGGERDRRVPGVRPHAERVGGLLAPPDPPRRLARTRPAREVEDETLLNLGRPPVAPHPNGDGGEAEEVGDIHDAGNVTGTRRCRKAVLSGHRLSLRRLKVVRYDVWEKLPGGDLCDHSHER